MDNKIQVTALHNKVVVGMINKSPTTAGGIIISGGDDSSSTQGLVLGVGPDAKDVNIGDKILLNWNKAVKVGSYDAYVVAETEIIAIIEE